MTGLKDTIARAIDNLGDDLEVLSRKIHDNPELGYLEVKAAGWLTEFLTGQGFKVERGVGGVETAFRATIETGDGPTIAILCEYDALPQIGHACGHTVMCHGFDQWSGHMDLLGIVRVGFEFTGKAAHAAADPWEGVNALDAAIQTYNNVSMLRQQVRPDSRIHGIITHGGAAPNIIPELAAATFYVRALNLDYMWEIHKRVIACAEGAAKSTGCGLKVIRSDDTVYETMKRNETLLGAFRANMKALGIIEGPPLG